MEKIKKRVSLNTIKIKFERKIRKVFNEEKNKQNLQLIEDKVVNNETADNKIKTIYSFLRNEESGKLKSIYSLKKKFAKM